MNNNELNILAKTIWAVAHSKFSFEDQIDMIKSELIDLSSSQRKIGRNQILSSFEDKLKELQS